MFMATLLNNYESKNIFQLQSLFYITIRVEIYKTSLVYFYIILARLNILPAKVSDTCHDIAVTKLNASNAKISI